MNYDQLFLLKPNFLDKGKGPFFCPGCAQMLGLLEFYPELRRSLSVHYVDFPRPRPELVALLGEANQSCPVLVLKAVPPGLPSKIKVQKTNNFAFVEGADEIAEYLARVHKIGIPH
jgi:hypothetical protein